MFVNRQTCPIHGSRISNARKGDPMAKVKRTTHRSSTGTKLYAVRDSKGRF